MSVMDDEERARYEMFKRVINLFEANPDWLRKEPKLIPPLAQLVQSVATIDAVEDGAYDDVDGDLLETDQELIARAEAILKVVTPYRKQFVKAGLREQFVEDLQAKIAELRKAKAKTES